ncbi:Mu1-adaptin [Coccomyxa subellipsoidea C-169]|uniref:Mu1-adaptin n=1 Tax=Coccomyxa subellipsoidea (strain C-169) TaxID=574566 RepID=I0YUT6_COCSC|nr:Mu1-adaptin [Coccomyxa subellipsoidea C-169]EIE22155.1 Mu1-adaptin [Coccomyxa subellipsoidea C-169]|eukprot:XP_005646699.1 Mu1-adaptin [Coccomyxa subellipsoidea C-169]
MAASAVFILDLKGHVILFRDYRGDVPIKYAERFITKLNELEETGKVTPIILDEGVSYLYVQYSNLYLLIVSRENVNAASMLLFLHKLREVFVHYFNELEEESLRDNFVIAYELLDEVMDYGYPQFTEAKILSEFIKTDAHKMEVQARPPMAVTNAVSWRSEGIRYKKNEVFLDVVESVNLLVNSNGTVVRSEVMGALKMRTFLSGMPECKLGLNDKTLEGRVYFMQRLAWLTRRGGKNKSVEMEDIKFHQCVRLARFENDRTISFIPPDGAFDLMKISTLEAEERSLNWLRALTRYSGTAVYVPEKEALVWKIKSFPGGREFLLRAKFSLPSVAAEEEPHGRMPPIAVNFEIPYFTVSGIQVRYLKVIEKSGYQALPWVRYITAGGEYEIRMA